MSGAAFRELASPLPGLAVLQRDAFVDSRGAFRRLFGAAELAQFGWDTAVAQVNHSVTARAGMTRGIHFQYPPHAEDKLVTCIAGRVWDVAVDLRAGSPTFLRWHAEELAEDTGRSMLLPKGFGHGFMALTDGAALVYVHSAPYAPQAEGGLHPLDPALGIAWPREVRDLSAKDAARPFIDPAFQGVAA
jgi:dTDP-4-dehydrorhamnose 3,5-epimerase